MNALSEISIQTMIRSRARIECPAVQLIAIPNAGKRTRWAAMQAKREGMRAGVCDLVALWPAGGCAWIEVKTEKGRVSDNQAEFLGLLDRYGHKATVARSVDEAMQFLRSCGAPFLTSVFD